MQMISSLMFIISESSWKDNLYETSFVHLKFNTTVGKNRQCRKCAASTKTDDFNIL